MNVNKNYVTNNVINLKHVSIKIINNHILYIYAMYINIYTHNANYSFGDIKKIKYVKII